MSNDQTLIIGGRVGAKRFAQEQVIAYYLATGRSVYDSATGKTLKPIERWWVDKTDPT